MLTNISAKNKTMLFVSVLLIGFSSILMWTIYADQKKKLLLLESKFYGNIKNSYEKVLEKHKEFYTNRAKSIIRSAGIIEAVKNKDRETIIRLSHEKWNDLRKENEYLNIMHFHAANETSIVRMHKSDLHEGSTTDIHSMISMVHSDKKPLYGFDDGELFLAYRTILPIFDRNKYIGTLEFGSRPDFILSEMKYYNNLSGALFITNHNQHLYKADREFNMGDFVLQYSNMEDPRLLTFLKDSGYAFENFCHTHFNGRVFNIYSLDIKNYKGTIVGKTILIHDISSAENSFETSMKKLGIFLIILLVLLLIVINIGFKKIISALDNTNENLSGTREAPSGSNAPFPSQPGPRPSRPAPWSRP